MSHQTERRRSSIIKASAGCSAHPARRSRARTSRLRHNGPICAVRFVDLTRADGYVHVMSLAQLKEHAAELDLKEQQELIAFLVARQTEQDEDLKRTLAEK